MNATDTSCRPIFPDWGEENPLWKSKRLYAAKLVLRCKQHILLFAQMRIHFARRGHLFVPNPSGWKSTLCRAIQVRWSTLKNRHEHPVTFHAAKLKRMINTLYINRYRQVQTEATTLRKDGAGMKKKGLFCSENGFEALPNWEITEAKNRCFEYVLSCCRTVVNKCCRA